MSLDADIDDLIEFVPCSLCDFSGFETVRPPSYPAGLSRQNLLEIYSASSDHVLFDAMVRCSGCGLIYLNPRVRADLIIESYSNAADPTFIDQNEERVKTFERSLRQLARRQGFAPDGTKRILDIGCAGGAFPKAAQNLGFEAVGVEPSRWLVEKGRELYGLDLRQGLLKDQHFPDCSFDLASLWDVIEHLPDPNEVIAEVHRILKPDGLLIVNYPDYGSVARKVLGNKWPMLLSVHLTYFTRTTILKFMQNHGFEVIEIKPFWQTLQLGYVLKRAGAYFSVFKFLGALAKQLKLHRIPITYNIGQSFLLARRSS